MTTYNCCGVESRTDREGITTSYTYDDLKRVTAETRAGITTLTSYDAEGRALTVTRQGSDGSQIVTSRNQYDLAGRQTSSTNALQRGTTYAYSTDANGHEVRTTTNPDSRPTLKRHIWTVH